MLRRIEPPRRLTTTNRHQRAARHPVGCASIAPTLAARGILRIACRGDCHERDDVFPFGPPPAPPPAAAGTARVTFSGQRRDFRRLVMRGAALELVTVGFYRFWLATDMRRHLWSNTAVDGDAAEYTGTAKELLIGFLFALAILAPIYLVYFLIGLEAERLQAFASRPARAVLLSVRPVRDLSRAPLPADPHGLARRALLDDRLGLELRMARRPVDAALHHHARDRAAVGQGVARTLQDAPHVLRRSARPLRGHRRRAVQARCGGCGF